jgi:hypothetical protein
VEGDGGGPTVCVHCWRIIDHDDFVTGILHASGTVLGYVHTVGCLHDLQYELDCRRGTNVADVRTVTLV